MRAFQDSIWLLLFRRSTSSLLGMGLVGAVLASANTTAWGQAAKPDDATAPSASTEIRYASREYLGKGVTKAQLSNGLTVLVREIHGAQAATVRCYVRNTGSAYEGRYLGMGVSHILEHLVAGGTTTKRSEEEIQEILDSMGGQTNAFTSTDVTAFYIDCPARHVAQAIELISEEMQFATIPESEYRREMGVVQRELEMGEAERPRMLHESMKSLLYTEHPMRHPTIGYLPVVQQVRREDVYAFYKERYVPQNLIFVVVGDVRTDTALAKVRDCFKDSVRTTERTAVLPQEPDQASPRSMRLEMEGETTHFSVGWPTIPLQHPDLYALDVASYLLAHGDSSRIAYRLRVEKPLAVLVDSSSYTPGFVKGWFDVTVECTPENLVACRTVIDDEVRRLQEELVPTAELAKVKRQKAAEHVFAQQTVQEQADSLATGLLSTGDPLFDDQYVAGIQRVTPEQVRAVARKYFRAETRNEVEIAPRGSRPVGGVEAGNSIESPVLRKQLANGLTLLIKRHAVTPTVSVQAFVKGGVLVDSEANSGLSALTCELMTRGTQKYNGRQIAEYFDSIGGILEVDSQRNSSYLKCLILKDDLDGTLDYVHQLLFKPTLSDDEFRDVVEQQRARLAARRANPQTEIMDFWAAQLPKSSPFSRTVLGTDEALQRLKVGDCRALHQQVFTPNNMVLAVYGDVDPPQVAARLEKLLGAQPRGPELALPKFPAAHAAAKSSRAQLERQRENTAMLAISYPTVGMKDLKTRATLEVFNSLLTGAGGLGGRLFLELRGEQLVYYVFGTELASPAPGYFLFLSQTRPETLDEVSQRIQSNVERLGKEGVPADEFRLAKERLLAAHAMSKATPAEQASQAALDELLGLGYDHDKSYDERIKAVTVEDLRAVVTKYFREPIVVTSAPPANAPPPKP